MILELKTIEVILINCLGIPCVHLGISWLCQQLPQNFFSRSETTTRSKKSLFFYRKLLRIRRWKTHLPDAAPWLNGFPKSSLQSTHDKYLQEFVAETRRGEFAHWLQWMIISLFVTWNPSPACWIIIGYAALMNAPCILNLRYTRIRLMALLRRKEQSRNSSK